MHRKANWIVAVCLAAAWSHAFAAAEAGDYIFLYGQIVNCTDDAQLVDIALVAKDGYAEFLGDIRVQAQGMNHQSITEQIADSVARRTGNKPTSLYVSIVAPEEEARIAMAHMSLMIAWRCVERDEREPQPPRHDAPPTQSEYFKRLVADPPDNGWQQTLDPAPTLVAAKEAPASSAAEPGRQAPRGRVGWATTRCN